MIEAVVFWQEGPEVLVDSKLHMNQPCTLAAKIAQERPGLHEQECSQ